MTSSGVTLLSSAQGDAFPSDATERMQADKSFTPS